MVRKLEETFAALGRELDLLSARVGSLERRIAGGAPRFYRVGPESRYFELVKVPCPDCFAEPGGMCVRMNGAWAGKRADYCHASRLRVARDAELERLEVDPSDASWSSGPVTVERVVVSDGAGGVVDLEVSELGELDGGRVSWNEDGVARVEGPSSPAVEVEASTVELEESFGAEVEDQ